MNDSDDMPDWPPAASAVDLPDGECRKGSTGQAFIVKNGQWIRVRKPRLVSDESGDAQ